MPELNYVAIVVVAVLNIILGMLWWHDALFGKPWRALMGWGKMSKAEMAKKKKEAGPAYATSAVSSLVMAFFIAGLLDMMQIDTLGGACRLAWVMWVAFVATTTLVDYMYAERKLKLWAINYGYHLAGMIMMSLVLVSWS